MKDAFKSSTTALPAAGAANLSDSIDLEQVAPGPAHPLRELDVTLPATPALVDTKNITLTLKQSPDNATWAAIPELATIVVTGAGGVGAAGALRRVKLPPTVQRYIALAQAVDAAGGNNTGVSTLMELVF